MKLSVKLPLSIYSSHSINLGRGITRNNFSRVSKSVGNKKAEVNPTWLW